MEEFQVKISNRSTDLRNLAATEEFLLLGYNIV
jgi:hypothetical protein